MQTLDLNTAFTLIEPGPVVLISTHDGRRDNLMTVSWTMVLEFSGVFALCTGAWNHSFKALQTTRECVIAIPTVDLIDQVVGIGMCSGADAGVDKFARFGLTRAPARHVQAPLVTQCLANIECRVTEFVAAQHIVVLQALAAYRDAARQETRTLHAVGDGSFVVDGRRLSRRAAMAAKLPPGV